MCYELQKPLTDGQRADFIVEYNHRLGLKIEDTEKYLFALESNEIMGEKEIDGELIPYPVINPNYEQEQARKERERVNNLKCTKRVFALILQELGITYSQLKSLISTNEQAQLEWDLCVELERSNPLLDIMAEQLNISSDTLDTIFKMANGEITQPEQVGE